MAKGSGRAKLKAPQDGMLIPSRTQLGSAISEINTHKSDATEASGLAGQATKQFADKWGVSKKALGFVVGASRMDPAKRTSAIRDLLMMIRGMGWTDQASMFDDLGSMADEIEKGLGSDGSGKGQPPSAEAVAEARGETTLAEAMGGAIAEDEARLKDGGKPAGKVRNLSDARKAKEPSLN